MKCTVPFYLETFCQRLILDSIFLTSVTGCAATYMIRDGGKTAPHKGYGFVVFKKASSADAAMEALNGTEHTPPLEICGQVRDGIKSLPV